MSTSVIPETRLSLILRVQGLAGGNARCAWDELEELYRPAIHLWCRRGLQSADAEEVTQNVMLKLLQKLERYDPALGMFRCWLRTVVRHEVCDLLRSRYRCLVLSDEVLDQLHDSLDRAFNPDETPAVSAAIQERIEARVGRRGWDVYWRSEALGWTADQVAKDLKITTSNAYVILSRVRKVVREERATLLEMAPPMRTLR